MGKSSMIGMCGNVNVTLLLSIVGGVGPLVGAHIARRMAILSCVALDRSSSKYASRNLFVLSSMASVRTLVARGVHVVNVPESSPMLRDCPAKHASCVFMCGWI